MIGALLAKRAVRRGFKLVERRKLDKLMAMYHDFAVFEFPTDTLMGGRFESREEIRAWYERWFERMPEIRFDIRHVLVEDITAVRLDNVVHVEWELTETDTDGAVHRLTGVSALEVEQGRCRRMKEYVFDQDEITAIWPVKEVAGS